MQLKSRACIPFKIRSFRTISQKCTFAVYGQIHLPLTGKRFIKCVRYKTFLFVNRFWWNLVSTMGTTSWRCFIKIWRKTKRFNICNTLNGLLSISGWWIRKQYRLIEKGPQHTSEHIAFVDETTGLFEVYFT